MYQFLAFVYETIAASINIFQWFKHVINGSNILYNLIHFSLGIIEFCFPLIAIIIAIVTAIIATIVTSIFTVTTVNLLKSFDSNQNDF